MKYTVQEAAVPAVSARAEQPLAVEHARTLAEVVDVVTRTYVEFRTARKREELVAGPLLFGICATGYAIPLPHTPCSITMVLVPNDADCIVTVL